MDLIILKSAFLSYAFFIILHILIFRKLDKSKIVNGLLTALSMAAVFNFIIYWLFTRSFIYPVHYSVPLLMIFFMVSFLLFILLTITFIMTILGMSTTSLRINLVLAIKNSGRKGIAYIHLLKKYNRDMIIKSRLERLVTAGELEEKEGCYYYKKNITLFKLYSLALMLLTKIYKMPLYKGL